MMKIVVGLGNPGNKYNFTRHNLGFLALDYYLKTNELTWEEKPRYNAIWSRDGDVIFVKPQGFYNDSGVPVAEFMRFYKIKPEDILVICDDFHLNFGYVRERAKGSAGGNNGLKSLISILGTEEFPRLRLGTGNEELRETMGDMDFVLSKFTPEEKEQLTNILAMAKQRIDAFVEAER